MPAVVAPCMMDCMCPLENSALNCAASCDRHAQCVSYVYVAHGGRCYLHNHTSPPARDRELQERQQRADNNGVIAAGSRAMHCVVDAITGALGLPDIGQLFPDTDPKWKGQTSDAFVREAVRLMELEGYAIGNLDCTLIAQRPKISPHKDSIRANVAKVLGVHESVVNVKAKTHEKVDSLGENRSIACHTVIMLIRA